MYDLLSFLIPSHSISLTLSIYVYISVHSSFAIRQQTVSLSYFSVLFTIYLSVCLFTPLLQAGILQLDCLILHRDIHPITLLSITEKVSISFLISSLLIPSKEWICIQVWYRDLYFFNTFHIHSLSLPHSLPYSIRWIRMQPRSTEKTSE